jgi:hypothetical protein
MHVSESESERERERVEKREDLESVPEAFWTLSAICTPWSMKLAMVSKSFDSRPRVVIAGEPANAE